MIRLSSSISILIISSCHKIKVIWILNEALHSFNDYFSFFALLMRWWANDLPGNAQHVLLTFQLRGFGKQLLLAWNCMCTPCMIHCAVRLCRYIICIAICRPGWCFKIKDQPDPPKNRAQMHICPWAFSSRRSAFTSWFVGTTNIKIVALMLIATICQLFSRERRADLFALEVSVPF